MSDDPKAKEALQRFSAMKAERSAYEPMWQDIRELVRPGTSDFQRYTSPGTTRTENQYDGTARQALVDLASALQAYNTNPADRWFGIGIEGEEKVTDKEALMWLDQVADIIYREYAHPDTNHQSALHENYLDLGGFGTAANYQEYDSKVRRLCFRAYPLAHCFIAESNKSRVDTVYRCAEFTLRQLVQEFGKESLPEKVREELESATGAKDPDKKYEVLHCVYPRSDRDPNKYNGTNKRYASLWVLKEYCHVLKEHGYDYFPYHVPRWEKLAGEVYGRSPATNCLPDIRVLNRIEYTMLKCGQRATDPPLILENDGFMLSFKTAPGSINFKEPGTAEVQWLEHKGNFPLTKEMSDQKRDAIRKAFYAEWVKIERKKERQTAYEIAEMKEEQLQMMSPNFGRLASELLNPMIAMSYNLLRDHGRIPHAPEQLHQRKLQVYYLSPAARAQKAIKAISIGRFMQEIIPVIQVKPDVIDAIDVDEAMQELARAREVPPNVIRSPEEIALIRAERNQQQQMMAAAEIAKPASEAIKNIATAQNLAAA